VELVNYKSNLEQEIVIVSPFYNCAQYIARCIQSVAAQDYFNYHHILIDDCSTDNTFEVVKSTIESLPKNLINKFTIIKNSERVGAVKNQISAIKKIVNQNAIIMLLDGDDSLVNDNTIFNYYNNIYDETTEFTYGSCWSMVDNIPLISQPYPESVKKSKSYRQHHFNWILPYTHLRTFKRHLLNDIDESQFKDSDGNWYRAGGDGAVFYAFLEQADPDKVKCLQQIVYNYNDINPLNDYKVNGEEQNRTARDIVSKNQTKKLEKYSVIIPTMWRADEILIPFLYKLCACESVGEIIIINNDVKKMPTINYDPKLKIFNFDENIYVNPAWNFGVAISQFDRLCIANDDISFDTQVFEKLQDQLTDNVGVFGLCPGDQIWNQPPVTTKTIDIIPWSGQNTHGFGCLMFIHKKSWNKIPVGLDIYYGDNYIFDYQLSKGKTNYLITNMDFYTPFASTTSDDTISGGFLEKESIIFNEVKNLMNLELSSFKSVDVKLPEMPDNSILEVKDLGKRDTTFKVIVPNKRILIAIPTARNIEPDTFKSIYDLKVPEGYIADFQYFFGYNIDQVRNLIAHWIVNGYDYLFSVDSDISFEPDTLEKLLKHDVDMVSGLYIQRKPGQHILEVYEHNGRGGVSNIPYEKIKGRGLVEIASCGFGCVLVKSQVMRAVGYPYFEYHSAIDHANTVSEDVDFCRKALVKGFKIWADTSIQCRHTGSFTFTVDNNIPALPEVKNLVDYSQRLRDLGNQRLLPQQTVDYLTNLKKIGIYPKVIYDIGACVLHWTNEAEKIWPDAEYIVFEAMGETEFLYQERGLKYSIGVLSDVSGKVVDFYQNTYHPGGNSYYKENPLVNPEAPEYFNESHKRQLKTMTLDDVVRDKNLPLPDLIKMDVQGAELDVIKGATETLKSAIHIILELQKVEYNTGAPDCETVIGYMKSIGFELVCQFTDAGPDGDYHFIRANTSQI